ncbi:serine hydrolase domain-containing protein [Desertivirga brevis]|uniref:serine hydrolase domain-containing protein n=1 Tax=Desertivirga brevis TaxID=2810310 RepID=UPI001A965938|nr:serine hydrolase domain-containing protein [Pedobacter sp. SYSU D00873]
MDIRPFRIFQNLFYLLILLHGLPVSAQTPKKLDSLFNAINSDHAFSGSVLIAENGVPVYERTIGYANFETREPITKNTMFELASVSKQFTAMAIMQLQEKNQLSYSDSLNKYFPDLPYHGITIRHLLNHTSGIPEFLGWDSKRVNTDRINYNSDILTAILKDPQPLSFRPGEQLSYSNTNYVLLALIIEKVSGIGFGDYLKSKIFNPIGMSNTRVYGQRAANPKIKDYAYGHLYDPAKGKFVINDLIAANRYQYYFDGVAGPYGISSTARDLLKWDQALYTDKLISKAGQDSAYQPPLLNNGKPAKLMGLPYGFGWLLMPERKFSGKWYMHTGGYPGYMSIIVRYPEKKKTIILLANVYNVFSIYPLAQAIEGILFDQPFTIPKVMPFKKSIVLSPQQIKMLEGLYSLKISPNVKFNITSEQGQLFAQLTGQPKVEIYPESELETFYTVVAARIKFFKNDGGVVNKLVLFQNGQELEATKEVEN